jgi:uncharacterized protein YbaP (TraB family)
MLYRVANTDTFLAGTIHVLPAGASHLPMALLEAHRRAQTVAFEWHLDGTGSPPPSDLLGPTTRLCDIVQAQTFDGLMALSRQLGLSVDIDTLKPWGAARAVMLPLMRGWGYQIGAGVDLQLWNATPRERRVVLDDENASWCFDRAPIAEQVGNLQWLVNDTAAGQRRIAHMLDAWRIGGDVGLGMFEDALRLMRDEGPVKTQGLMDDRNAVWLPKIQRIAKEGKPALILVGALHLVGPTGLLEGLRAAGLPLHQT